MFYKDDYQFQLYIGDGIKYREESYYPVFSDSVLAIVEDPEPITEVKKKIKEEKEEEIPGDQ